MCSSSKVTTGHCQALKPSASSSAIHGLLPAPWAQIKPGAEWVRSAAAVLGGRNGGASESGQHLLPAGCEDDVPLLIHFDVTNDHLATGGPAIDRHKPVL